MDNDAPSPNAAKTSATPLMTAYRIREFGPPEAITAERVERPTPGTGEVLVRVAAGGVGPWDGWIRAGRSVLPQPLPLTLGSDLSGTIETVGAGVTSFRPGDAVYGVTNPRFIGAYAEYAIAVTGMIGPKPATLTHIEAASVPVIAVTAHEALFQQAGLTAGQSVLIHGGAGNVGAYAVQFARQAGLRVFATSAGADSARVRALGADEVIDFSAERFEDRVANVDAVIDLVGGESQVRSFSVLRRGGKLISTVSQPDQTLAERHGVEARFFLVTITTAALTEIAEQIDGGKLVTNIGMVLPLADARVAHEMLEGTRPGVKGKIVLRVGE